MVATPFSKCPLLLFDTKNWELMFELTAPAAMCVYKHLNLGKLDSENQAFSALAAFYFWHEITLDRNMPDADLALWGTKEMVPKSCIGHELHLHEDLRNTWPFSER